MIDVERRLFQPHFQDRRDMQPLGDHRLEVFEEVARVAVGQAKDRHAPDMHRHFRRFQVQKRRVHRGQLPGFTHCSLPLQIKRALVALLPFSRCPGSRDTGQDCACS